MALNRQLEWTSQFLVDGEHPQSLQGDKILLPPSALEQLLAAAPVISDTSSTTNSSQAPSFDPFNPYSFAAERHARAQTRYEHQQLPNPLTFRLVNPTSGRVVYAGIKEFSAEEGHAVLSDFLAQALGIKQITSHGIDGQILDKDLNEHAPMNLDPTSHPSPPFPRITIHAKQLPRGEFVKLRPLEAGYDPEDWKALLEEHLRKNYTTLTKGEVLSVPSGRSTSGGTKFFQFLADELRPDGDAVCVVDTDLEVDIEALNEEQARETVRQVAAKAQKKPGSATTSSVGGLLDLFRSLEGQVLPGEYVDYQLPSWDRSQGIEIEMLPTPGENELELFASPYGNYQRARPREDEYAFVDYETQSAKRIRISPTNIELENAEALWVSVHAPPAPLDTAGTPKHYRISAKSSNFSKSLSSDETANTPATPTTDEVQCKNCLQIVPKRTLVLHENFCLRNNILCPNGCGGIFQKRSEDWQNHWHCAHDSSWGNTTASHSRHDYTFHEPVPCPNCTHIAPSLATLATHRVTTCPGKLILCRFCHLEVPQEGDPDGAPNAEALLSGLTVHELADGARTTECHICQRIVRLRDMVTHMKHHDLERNDRPSPRLCRNIYCGRTLDGTSPSGDTRAGSRMGQGAGNDIGLCSSCFGPFYVSMYDPEGKALKRRVERRYLSQILSGCGKSWCRNEYCKSGRQHGGIEPAAVTTKDALPIIKPMLDGLTAGSTTTPLQFCVDEGSQKRMVLAEMLAAEGGTGGNVSYRPGAKAYSLNWCVGALEAEGGEVDRAAEWLRNFAPSL